MTKATATRARIINTASNLRNKSGNGNKKQRGEVTLAGVERPVGLAGSAVRPGGAEGERQYVDARVLALGVVCPYPGPLLRSSEPSCRRRPSRTIKAPPLG